MVTMAQSAANWHNTHAHMDRMHSLTHYTSTQLLPPRGTRCETPAQLLFFSACWVFACFCNPPNSDMDCRIFNVHTCVRIHSGVGHTDSESAQHF